MPMKPSDVLGEGSYGCIHKPSLVCKDNKKVSYKNKVSKVLLTEHAISELKEFLLISESDKNNEYFLGVPDLCKVKPTKMALKSIEKCRKLTKKNKNAFTKKTLDQYSLLVMNNGGIDLESFGLECGKMSETDNNKNKVITFWKETSRLLRGLSIFQKHDIIHFDLKPQNIVYDSKKNRINFIDFGHMRKITDAISSCTNSSNGLVEEAFWNYPFEVQFLNKDIFLEIAKMSENDREIWYSQFLKDIESGEDVPFVIAYETFMDMFTENLSMEEKNNIRKHYEDDFYKTLMHQISLESYDEFLEKSIKTIDIYGIGLAFQYMLNYSRHLLPLEFIQKMSELAYHMSTSDLSKRYMIDDVINIHTKIIDILS